MTIEDELAEDVGSLERVRLRLSKSPDDQLPKILAALVPKLLARLELSLAVDSHESSRCLELNLLVQTHINGVLGHSLERLRGNQSLRTDTLITGVIPFALSKNAVLGTWSLLFVQYSIPRCTWETLPTSTIPHLIQSIDELHTEATTQASNAILARLSSAAWLFFDCVMMSTGAKPFLDWDLGCCGFGDLRWQIQNSNAWGTLASDSAVTSACENGSGVLHLVLDLLLFWPSELAEHSGISRDSEALLHYRHRKQQNEHQLLQMQTPRNSRENGWNDSQEIYLRHLKLSALRYTIWPLKTGLFQGQNSDRALLLAVLFASQDSMHGRLASDYLNLFCASKKQILQKEGGLKGSTSQYSLQLTFSLLILMVGDERAAPVLKHFEIKQNRAPWKQVLGEIPLQDSRKRPPLPSSISSRVTWFLLNHRLKIEDSNIEKAELQLLVDLVLRLATRPEVDGSFRNSDDRKLGKYWAAQLTQIVMDQLLPALAVDGIIDDPWINSIVKTLRDLAVEVLSALVEIGGRHNELPLLANQDLPLGVETPFQQRYDLNRMLHTHRSAQKRQKMTFNDAVNARQVAYGLIAKCAQLTIRRDERPFELPILLLRCSTYEDHSMQKYVEQANSALLDLYSDITTSRDWTLLLAGTTYNDTAISQEQLVVPILPAILDAMCSDSRMARSLALQWIRRFLNRMDVDASSYLLGFLTKDVDSQIASSANEAVELLIPRSKNTTLFRASFEYFDTSTFEGMEKIQTILQSRMRDVSSRISISSDSAAALLVDHSFCISELVSSYLLDMETTLRKSGLTLTVSESARKTETWNEDKICGICYGNSTEDNFLALDCGHQFCQECWITYLETLHGEKKYAYLDATCPQHDCSSRVLLRHLMVLSPTVTQKWHEMYRNAFLDMDISCRSCPTKDCSWVAVLKDPERASKHTSFKCLGCCTQYCFDCRAESHLPATCAAMREWELIQTNSDFWVRRNAKPCPGCHAPIEKTQGCNHMTCTCRVEFCWLCLTKLRSYSENHTCNRYDPTNDAENDSARRALFVAERYENHLQAEKFAEKQYNATAERPDKLADTFWFISEDEEDVFCSALSTLIEARKYLRHSYVASFELRRSPELLTILENYQGALEMLTERLSQLTEYNLQGLYREKGEHGVTQHFRGLDFYRVSVEKYIDRFSAALLKARPAIQESMLDTL